MAECHLFLYILNLPVNWFHTIRLQKFIRLAEMPASEKSPVRRQWAWMRCCQDQMLWIGQHRYLALYTIGLSWAFTAWMIASVNCSQPCP